MVYRPISGHTHGVIAHAIERARTASQIARIYGVSKPTVERASSNKYHFGTTRPKMDKRGRQRTLSTFQEEWICDLSLAKSGLYAAEVTWEIFDEWELVVTPRVVYDTWARAGFSRKVMRRDASQRSQLLQNTWQGTMASFPQINWCFLMNRLPVRRPVGGSTDGRPKDSKLLQLDH